MENEPWVEEFGGWRWMKSAPKDGTQILLAYFFPTGACLYAACAYWSKTGERWSHWHYDHEPHAWRPLFDTTDDSDSTPSSSRTVPLSKAPAKVVCGYCRAEFDTRADLTRHDNEAHGRKDRLLEERNWLNNSFGQGSAIDGRIRDRIAEIDEMLSEGTVPLSSSSGREDA